MVFVGPPKFLTRISAEKVLSLKVGAPVILLSNLSAFLVNGRRGMVHKLEEDGPTVNFGGRLVKMEKFHFTEGSAKRIQYPLKLAYAVTIHRAQGQTLENVVVDCTDLFAPGQLGVAVGRATKLGGLQVLNYSRKVGNIPHSPQVYHFYAAEHRVSSLCCRTKQVDVGEVHTEDDFRSTTPGPAPVPESTDANVIYIKDILNRVKLSDQQLTTKQDSFNNAVQEITNFTSVHRLLECFKSTLPDNFFNMAGMPSKDQTTVYQAIHAFFMQDTFMEHLKSIFNRTIESVENRIGTKIIQIWVDMQLTNQLENKQQQAASASSSAEESEGPLPDDVRAKIRYISGACTAKLAYKFQVKLRNSLYMESTIDQANRNTNLIAMKLFKGLHVMESDIAYTTRDPESLAETARKQNLNRALKNISDEAFDFFLHTYKLIMQINIAKMIASHEGNTLNMLVKQLCSCDFLIAEWLQLTAEPDADDLYVSIQLESYDCVMKWFCKVWMKDYVAIQKPQMVKSKQAETNLPLRTFIRGASSKRPVEEQPTSTRKSTRKKGKKSVKDPCGLCGKNVKEEAVACDICDKWYHFSCLHIDRDDETLQQDTWYCKNCK